MGILGIFADVLRAVSHGWFLIAAHYLAECSFLVIAGSACVLAEIRPHQVVNENAPYLNKLAGRAAFYALMSMYIIGRKIENPGSWQAWVDTIVGVYLFGNAIVGMVFAYKMSGLPPA